MEEERDTNSIIKPTKPVKTKTKYVFRFKGDMEEFKALFINGRNK